jgi:hypothetical protein
MNKENLIKKLDERKDSYYNAITNVIEWIEQMEEEKTEIQHNLKANMGESSFGVNRMEDLYTDLGNKNNAIKNLHELVCYYRGICSKYVEQMADFQPRSIDKLFTAEVKNADKWAKSIL